jgi:L-amino acid N-acyltransferase YncA
MQSGALQIRHADPIRDAAACVEIYTPFVTDSAVSFDIIAPTVPEFSAKIAHLLETHAFLVAEDDGAVAGYAYSGPYRERAAYRWSAEVSVYVHPDFRGRGVGRQLYDVLLEVMRGQGLRTAIAGITQPNPASMALHHSCGFASVGVFERIGYKAGAWRDVAFLALELDPDADPTVSPDEPRPARLPGD